MAKGRGRPRKKVVPPTPAVVREIFPQVMKTPDSQDTSGTSRSELGESQHRPVASGGVDTSRIETTEESPVIEPVADTAVTGEVSTGTVDKKMSWVDVISGNRLPSRGLEIPYTPPLVIDGEFVVEIEDTDIVSELEFWANSLIMYVASEELSMNAVKNFMQKVWNFISLPELYYHDEGYFIIRFQTGKDLHDVMKQGPYTIYGMPMFLKPWTKDFVLKDDLMRVMPIWVQLPRLPLFLWGEKSLGKIASALGKPMVTDECTAKKLRVSYARIMVEVDITKPLKEVVVIKDKQGNRIDQPVKYEWRPPFCQKCQRVGHICEKKGNAPQQKVRNQHVHRQQLQAKPNDAHKKTPDVAASVTMPASSSAVTQAENPIVASFVPMHASSSAATQDASNTSNSQEWILSGGHRNNGKNIVKVGDVILETSNNFAPLGFGTGPSGEVEHVP